MSSIRGVQGSERILAKLRKMISSAEYYEAHQLYRTLFFRYSNSKKFVELRQLLFEGANLFLSNDQTNSGADLAGLYLSALATDPSVAQVLISPDEASRIYENIGKLFAQIPEKTPERMQFTITALKLEPSSVFNISSVHHQFALVLWHERNYPEARYHFLHSWGTPSSDECARMLIEYQVSSGTNAEVDMFIAQFILQLLCIKSSITSAPASTGSTQSRATNAAQLQSLDNVEAKSLQHAFANKTLQSFATRHPRISKKNPPYMQPLLNFLWFLLIAIDGGQTTTFKSLCDLYATALTRDPFYKQYLTRIGELYFGLKPPPRNVGFGGIFGNLLQSLMEDDMDEGSDIGSVPVVQAQQAQQRPTQNRTVQADNDLD